MSTGTIVVVDDQPEMRRLMADLFKARGRALEAFSSGEQALPFINANEPAIALVVLDLELGSGQRNGIEICKELSLMHPDLPIVILTGRASIDAAVSAVKAGAVDFIVKDPYLEDTLDLAVEKVERMMAHVRERKRLEDENQQLRETNRRLREIAGRRWEVVGSSSALANIMAKIERVAPVPRPVLVLGDRGTGKELVARAIHHLSPRSSEPFVTMNCAAVAESLLESELFGHEQGAFTGATRQKEGKFELADGGTLFLDEIGNMSVGFQTKILRVLEYQRFERVAGSDSIQVDVRVIAATNADLTKDMETGKFRRDLYDRLAFEVIQLPPLRDRKDDIRELARHFVRRFREEVSGISVVEVSEQAIARLQEYSFPGNVRELKNVVERAVYAARGQALTAEDVAASLPPGEKRADVASSLAESADDPTLPLIARVEAFEHRLCKDALVRARYNQREAAELVGVTYDQFRQRYRKYRLGKE